MSGLRDLAAGLCDVASALFSVVADAIDQPFDEREASGFLTNSAAGVVAEPASAPVEPVPPEAPGADRRLLDPGALLREAADYIGVIAPVCDQVYGDQLIAGLRDLAAQFDADANPLTPESQDQ